MNAVIPILRLGETAARAYRGDRGKIAYDHSQVTSGNPHGVSWASLLAKPSVPEFAGIKLGSVGANGELQLYNDIAGSYKTLGINADQQLEFQGSIKAQGLNLTGTTQGVMDWQTSTMPFPARWSWQNSDFSEGQIDVNFSWSLNPGRVLNTHPEFSMNYENFFIQPGGQEILEHNWAYDPKGGGVNAYRPYQFHLICGPVGNANLHKSSHEFRNVYSWNIFNDLTGTNLTLGLTDTAADKRFQVNRRISGSVPTTLNQPLFSMGTSTAITGSNLLLFTGVLSTPNTSGLEIDMSGTGVEVNGILIRSTAPLKPIFCETSGASTIRGVFGAGTADSSFTFSSNGNPITIGNDHSAQAFSISVNDTLGTSEVFKIDCSSGGTRGRVTCEMDHATGLKFGGTTSHITLPVGVVMRHTVNGLQVADFNNNSGTPQIILGGNNATTGNYVTVESSLAVGETGQSRIQMWHNSGYGLIGHGNLAKSFNNSSLYFSPSGGTGINAASGQSIGFTINNDLQGSITAGLFSLNRSVIVRATTDGADALRINDASNNRSIALGTVPSAPSYGAVYLGSTTPSASNYTFASDSINELNINNPVRLRFLIGNSERGSLTTSDWRFERPLTIQPAADSQSVLLINRVGAPSISMGSYPGAASYAGIWMGGVSPSSSNYTLATNGSDTTLLNIAGSGGTLYFRLQNSDLARLNNTNFTIDRPLIASTLTSNGTVQVGTGGSLLKNNAGTIEVRDSADTGFRDLSVRSVTSNTGIFKLIGGYIAFNNAENVIMQGGTNVVKVQANSGLNVRNLADTQFADLQAGQGNFNFNYAASSVGNALFSQITYASTATQARSGYFATPVISGSGGTTNTQGLVVEVPNAGFNRVGLVLLSPGNNPINYGGTTAFQNDSSAAMRSNGPIYTNTGSEVGLGVGGVVWFWGISVDTRANQAGVIAGIRSTISYSSASVTQAASLLLNPPTVHSTGVAQHVQTAYLGVPTAGVASNSALAIGANPTSGNWAVFNNSTNPSWFNGPLHQSWSSGVVDPTTGTLADGKIVAHKRTDLGEVRFWCNDGGTIKKLASFT